MAGPITEPSNAELTSLLVASARSGHWPGGASKRTSAAAKL